MSNYWSTCVAHQKKYWLTIKIAALFWSRAPASCYGNINRIWPLVVLQFIAEEVHFACSPVLMFHINLLLHTASEKSRAEGIPHWVTGFIGL